MKSVQMKKMIVLAAVLTASVFAQAEQLYSLRQICGSIRTVGVCNGVPYCTVIQNQGKCVQVRPARDKVDFGNGPVTCAHFDQFGCVNNNSASILGCEWRQPKANYSCVPAL